MEILLIVLILCVCNADWAQRIYLYFGHRTDFVVLNLLNQNLKNSICFSDRRIKTVHCVGSQDLLKAILLFISGF